MHLKRMFEIVLFYKILLIGLCQEIGSLQVNLRYYYQSLDDNYETSIEEPLNLLEFPKFDLNKPTVFYAHGYLEQLSWESIRTVISAYLERADHNVVLVDWSKINGPLYFLIAAPNAIRVGQALGGAIYSLMNSGMNPLKIHLVGHSLGGQTVGYAGKSLENKLHRITVLDAANPGFYGLGLHIQASDAEFVDAIHTDAGIYGARFPTAQVDFWPNGGVRVQPGCPETIPLTPFPLSPQDICSHWRSWRFWSESLLNEKAFPARKCGINYFSHYNRMRYINDEEDEVTYMGYAAKKGLTGNYCLETRDKSPFGLGDNATISFLANNLL